MVKTKTQDLSKIRDIDLDSITIRDVNGDDMMDAGARCIPPDGGQLDMNMFGLLMRQQMVIQAIVAYTPRGGTPKACAAPPVEAVKWNNRTKEYVGMVYDYVNSVETKEREDFQKALAAPPPGSSEDAGAAST